MPGLFKPSPPMVLLHLRSIPPPRGVAVECILTDNGKNYTSRAFRETAADHGIRLKRTRPYRPQTNGKAEAFNKILQAEWRPYESNSERSTHSLGSWGAIIAAVRTAASAGPPLPPGCKQRVWELQLAKEKLGT